MAVDQISIASIKRIDDQRAVARAYAPTEQNPINAYKEFERGWKLVKKYEVHEIISANVFGWTTTFDPKRVAS